MTAAGANTMNSCGRRRRVVDGAFTAAHISIPGPLSIRPRRNARQLANPRETWWFFLAVSARILKMGALLQCAPAPCAGRSGNDGGLFNGVFS